LRVGFLPNPGASRVKRGYQAMGNQTKKVRGRAKTSTLGPELSYDGEVEKRGASADLLSSRRARKETTPPERRRRKERQERSQTPATEARQMTDQRDGTHRVGVESPPLGVERTSRMLHTDCLACQRMKKNEYKASLGKWGGKNLAAKDTSSKENWGGAHLEDGQKKKGTQAGNKIS